MKKNVYVKKFVATAAITATAISSVPTTAFAEEDLSGTPAAQGSTDTTESGSDAGTATNPPTETASTAPNGGETGTPATQGSTDATKNGNDAETATNPPTGTANTAPNGGETGNAPSDNGMKITFVAKDDTKENTSTDVEIKDGETTIQGETEGEQPDSGTTDVPETPEELDWTDPALRPDHSDDITYGPAVDPTDTSEGTDPTESTESTEPTETPAPEPPTDGESTQPPVESQDAEKNWSAFLKTDSETGKCYYDMVYTIQDNAEGDQVLELTKATEVLRDYVKAQYGKDGYNIEPGDVIQFKITIQSKSGHTYAYKDGSFVLATPDLKAEGEDLPEGFDNQKLPAEYQTPNGINITIEFKPFYDDRNTEFGNDLYKICADKAIEELEKPQNAERKKNLLEKLKGTEFENNLKDFFYKDCTETDVAGLQETYIELLTGGSQKYLEKYIQDEDASKTENTSSLEKYVLKYYSNRYATTYENLDSLFKDHPEVVKDLQTTGTKSLFQDKSGNGEKLKIGNSAVGWNNFYDHLLSFAYGKDILLNEDGKVVDKNGNPIETVEKDGITYSLQYDKKNRPYLCDQNGNILTDQNGDTVYYDQILGVAGKVEIHETIKIATPEDMGIPVGRYNYMKEGFGESYTYFYKDSEGNIGTVETMPYDCTTDWNGNWYKINEDGSRGEKLIPFVETHMEAENSSWGLTNSGLTVGDYMATMLDEYGAWDKANQFFNDLLSAGVSSDKATWQAFRMAVNLDGELTGNDFQNTKWGWYNSIILEQIDGNFTLEKVDENGNTITEDEDTAFYLWYDEDGNAETQDDIFYYTKDKDENLGFVKYNPEENTMDYTINLKEGNLSINCEMLETIVYYLQEAVAPKGYEVDTNIYIICDEEQLQELEKANGLTITNVANQDENGNATMAEGVWVGAGIDSEKPLNIKFQNKKLSKPKPDPKPDPDPKPNPDPETEIPEEEVPLAPTPEESIEIPDPDVPLAPIVPEVTIGEEEVPLASAEKTAEETAVSQVPQTGDTAQVSLFASLFVGSGLLAALLGRKKRSE